MNNNVKQSRIAVSRVTDHHVPLTDAEIRRSTYTAIFLALILPPFVGGTLMGFIGFYPMPEFYLIFTSYSAPYLAVVVALMLYLTPRMVNFVCGLEKLERGYALASAQQVFARLPWFLLGGITLYSILGAISADISIEAMGYKKFTLRDHLYNQFGLIPVVLMTSFPIFFYYIDRLGRYLGPRGISVVAIHMRVKLLMLGIVTPLLIGSLLIGYYVNHTGYFKWQTFIMLAFLLLLAAGNTWLTLRSIRQGISPMQAFINAPSMALAERARINLMPLSLDEFGALTARFGELLSARRQLSGELQRAEVLANAVIDHAGALVLVLDREGHIVRFNQACEELSGYRFDEVVGQYPWDMLLPLEEAEEIRSKAFEKLAADAQSAIGRYSNNWVTKSGEQRLLDWTNTVLLDDQGKMEFMISVGMDVTEKARVERTLRESEARLRQFNDELEQRVAIRTQELQQANIELHDSLQQLGETQAHLVQAEKMASLGGMVAGVAHEINTPVGVGITAITHLQMKLEDYAGRYQAGQLTREDFEALLAVSADSSRIIHANLQRAADLIRGFKQVAVDQTSNERRQFNLREYLYEILQSLSPRLKPRGHQVLVECHESLVMHSQPGALSQVITNLVMNSLLHGFEDRKDGHIRIVVTEIKTGTIRLDYSDDGKGIPVEHRQKVFEPFFTTRRGQGGTGLGLHIVFNLVSQTLGGRISCQDVEGRGAAFRIELPVDLVSRDAPPGRQNLAS